MDNAVIPGGSSYKIHCNVSLPTERGINGQNFQYSALSSEVLASSIDEMSIKPLMELKACAGCGARQHEILKGRTICSYCKGEK